MYLNNNFICQYLHSKEKDFNVKVQANSKNKLRLFISLFAINVFYSLFTQVYADDDPEGDDDGFGKDLVPVL